MMKLRALRFFLCVVLCWGVFVRVSGEVMSGERDAEAASPRDLSPRSKKNSTLNAESREVIWEIDAIEAELGRVLERLKDLSGTLERLERENRALEASLEEKEKRYRKTRVRAVRRLYALSKVQWLGISDFVRAVDDDVYAVIHCTYALRKLFHEDSLLMKRLLREHREVKSLKNRLEGRRARLLAVRKDLEAQRKRLGRLKEQKILHLVRLHDRNASKFKPEGSRADSQKEGGKQKRIRRSRVHRPFAECKGRLPLPVDGRARLRRASKNRSPYPSILYNDGVLIEAEAGTLVRAVHDGTVVFADLFRGYGNLMIIDHGDHYFSLMARLGGFLKQPGDRVRSGEAVAVVGGNSDGSKGVLYFELRHRERPLRVTDWLAVGTSIKS